MAFELGVGRTQNTPNNNFKKLSVWQKDNENTHGGLSYPLPPEPPPEYLTAFPVKRQLLPELTQAWLMKGPRPFQYHEVGIGQLGWQPCVVPQHLGHGPGGDPQLSVVLSAWSMLPVALAL